MSGVFSPRSDVIEGVSDFDEIVDVKVYPEGELKVENLETKNTLQLILEELRKINVQLSILTREEL